MFLFGQHLVKVMQNSLDPDCPSNEKKWAACGADILVAMLTKDLQELKPYCLNVELYIIELYIIAPVSRMFVFIFIFVLKSFKVWQNEKSKLFAKSKKFLAFKSCF